jgi:hypothetical protein
MDWPVRVWPIHKKLQPEGEQEKGLFSFHPHLNNDSRVEKTPAKSLTMHSVTCSSTAVLRQRLRQQGLLTSKQHVALSRMSRKTGGCRIAPVCMASSQVSQGQASSSPKSATPLSRRREVLATIATSVSVGAFGLGSLPCEASVLDGLKEYKRDSNAKFLVGPIRLVRQRMFNVLTLTEGSSPQYGEAQEALRKASLDCLEPAGLFPKVP